MSTYYTPSVLISIPAPALQAAAQPRRLRPATIPIGVVLQFTVCLLVITALLSAGNPTRASQALFGMVALLSAIHCLRGNPQAAAVIVLGSVPAMMLLRNFFLFSGPIAILWAVCAAWALLRWSDFAVLCRKGVFLAFLIAAIGYWWISFSITGDYASNLRALELAGAATLVALLGTQRRYFSAALICMAAAMIGLAVGLLPYSERLGLATIGGDSFGNPVTYGTPAALLFLAAVADGGRWLTLQPRPLWAAIAAGAMGVCLLLSASRGSWIVAAAGVVVIVALGRFGRKMLVWPVIILSFAVAVLLASPKGAVIEAYFQRAFGAERTWNQRTSGRATQWIAAGRMTTDIPAWGFGPGSGYLVHQRYVGYPKAWHSLYLHLFVETGAIGSLILGLILVFLFRHGLRRRALTGESLPLAGLVGYCAVGISVAAMDAGSGVLLGIAFAGADLSGIVIVRRLRAA
jgi:O-antigen ligase